MRQARPVAKAVLQHEGTAANGHVSSFVKSQAEMGNVPARLRRQ